jgi:hypothetical protein
LNFTTLGFIQKCWPKRLNKIGPSYDHKLEYYSQYSWIEDVTKVSEDPPDVFVLQVYYKTLDIEERKETLVYDLGNFLSAIGGNLVLIS